jgi:hypothetical protein
MKKNNDVSDSPDKLTQELEELNAKIQRTLEGGTLSAEGLQTLINETEEMQKRLITGAKSTDQENTILKVYGKE